MTTRAIRARDNVHMLVEHRGMRPEVDPSAWYGEPRGDDLLARVMPRQVAWLAHRDDRTI